MQLKFICSRTDGNKFKDEITVLQLSVGIKSLLLMTRFGMRSIVKHIRRSEYICSPVILTSCMSGGKL